MVNPCPGEHCSGGFTLLEVLLSIVIVAILATLTIAGVRHIRERVLDARTCDRMQDIVTALLRLGQGEGSAALVIQRDAGIDGVLQWRVSQDRSEMVKRTKRIYTDNYSHGAAAFADWVPQNLPDTDYWKRRGLSDPFPDRNIGWIADHAYADPVKGGEDDGSRPFLRIPWGQTPPEEIRRSTNTADALPDVFLLRHCSPHRTRQLLAVAGIAPAEGTGAKATFIPYMTDRNPRRDWNDAWGRPLIVSFAMYQPPRNCPRHNFNASTNDPATFGEDIVLNAAKDRYRTIHQFYITTAAAGPVMPEIGEARLSGGREADWTGSGGVPALIWRRVAVGRPDQDEPPVCQQGTWDPRRQRWLGEWDQGSFDHPPFQGVRVATWTSREMATYRCFLAAPQIID